MADPTAAPPAGWLLDPDDSSLLRWWDGSGWAAFRRPREVPAGSPVTPATSAPAARPGPPDPRAVADPTAAMAATPRSAPVATTAAWAPGAAAPTGRARRVQLAKASTEPAPDVETTPTANGPTAAEAFAGSWDTAVDALLAVTPSGRRTTRAAVLGASRRHVLRSAFPDEEVFEAFDVVLHAAHALTGGLGAPIGEAGLFATDRRMVIIADDLRIPLREVLLDEIETVDLIGRGAVRFGLTDSAPPLLLTGRRGYHGGEVAELVMTLLDF